LTGKLKENFMAAPLETHVRQQPNIAVIDLKGDIDGAGEDALQNAYREAVTQKPRAVLLNFAGVSYINSKGIALIVMLLAQARKSGTRLLTTGLSPHYIEIFNITRLSDFMKFYPDEASALASST
jgi:anti-anti-sigma factor